MKLIAKNIKIIIKTGITLSLLSGLSALTANAQLNPMGGLFFQNQYLGNPAMAGLERGMNLNVGVRQQWSAMPGTPKTQSLTADYSAGKKVGLGLNIHNDEAGLLKRTRAMATYSYHLPLNDESQKLHFGVSFGFMDERVMNEQINGDQSDMSVGKFNQRETYMDGDFGIAYTGKKVSLQVAVPNMKSFLKKDQINSSVDRSTFFSSASYRFSFDQTLDGLDVEPKIAYRGVYGYEDIFDMGANLSFAKRRANIMAMYHSTESATFGMGVSFNNMALNGMYSTETSALRGYVSGNFELNLKMNLFGK